MDAQKLGVVDVGDRDVNHIIQTWDAVARRWIRDVLDDFAIAQDAYFHILDRGSPEKKYRIVRCDLQPLMLVENMGDKR